jgi:hypothetical protein
MSNPVVRITKKENVVVDGVKYKAIKAASNERSDTCVRCSFRSESHRLCGRVNCIPWYRKDGRSVYFEVAPKKS